MRPGLRRCVPLLAGIMASLLLSGCAGAPFARQLASSLGMRLADNVTGQLVDNQLKSEREQQNINIRDTEPDPYLAKFLLTQLPEEEPAQVVVEPLPQHTQVEYGEATVSASRLVPVEIWNLILGEEKQAMLERGLQNGSLILPPPIEWKHWRLATGGLVGQSDAKLYFLIPPDFGKVNSGDRAIIEIAALGGIHVARYRSN